FVLLDFAALLLLDGGAIAQADAARLRADLDDLEVVFFARLERASALERAGRRAETAGAFVAAAGLFGFGVLAKGFDFVAEIDERAEDGDAGDFALHDLADTMLFEPVAPDVVDLLHAQRHAAIFRIDLQHLGCDGLTLLEDFVRVLDALSPADVAHV